MPVINIACTLGNVALTLICLGCVVYVTYKSK
jgi:hypothetical protein